MELLERLAWHYEEMAEDDWRDTADRRRLRAKGSGVRTAVRLLTSLDSR